MADLPLSDLFADLRKTLRLVLPPDRRAAIRRLASGMLADWSTWAAIVPEDQHVETEDLVAALAVSKHEWTGEVGRQAWILLRVAAKIRMAHGHFCYCTLSEAPTRCDACAPRSRQRKNKIDLAIIALRDQPEATNTEIARLVGVARETLSRSAGYKDARKKIRVMEQQANLGSSTSRIVNRTRPHKGRVRKPTNRKPK